MTQNRSQTLTGKDPRYQSKETICAAIDVPQPGRLQSDRVRYFADDEERNSCSCSNGDKVSTVGLHRLLGPEGSSAELALHVVRKDGSEHTIPVSHDMSKDQVPYPLAVSVCVDIECRAQIEWWKQGSALNAIRARNAAKEA